MLYLRWTVRILVWGMLIAVISNACTTINMINTRLEQLMYVDSKLTSYVALFEIEGKLRNVEVNSKNLTMLFGKTGTKDEPNIVGTCQMIGGYPLVIIDKDYFNSSNGYDQEELVFHELGHCLLGRDHCEVKSASRMPVSIMEPSVVGTFIYSNNREAMLNELFKPHPGCPDSTKHSNKTYSPLNEWKDLELD